MLTSAFADGVTVSLRLRFEATVMRSRGRGRPHLDLVEELIGEEAENDHTHRPEGTHEVLNEIVVDRGPNPSKLKLSMVSYVGRQGFAHTCPHCSKWFTCQVILYVNVHERDSLMTRKCHMISPLVLLSIT